MKTVFISIAFVCAFFSIKAQTHVTYAGNTGRESFTDVVQLSNGDILVSGSSENLTWINATVPTTMLGNSGTISNALGGGEHAILVLFDSTSTIMKHVVYLPLGVAENFRMIKTTNLPLQATGEMFISGKNDDSQANGGGYFIGKLNNNFVNGIPTAFTWVNSIWAEGEVKNNPPWDVSNSGEVSYVTGQATASSWACVHRLNSNGQRKYVEGWRTHWKADGSEFQGFGVDYSGPLSDLVYSGIPMKSSGRCDLRSTTLADYDATYPDGNGGTRKGKWPMDFLFNSPCTIGAVSTSGPGYNGYKIGGSSVYGTSALAIDKRNNDLYLGWNTKSILPDGLPDFEPAIMKMNSNGDMIWWSRLYHEIQPLGDTMLSTPDQFIDGLAVDYSVSGAGSKVVAIARCHGNNVENFWEGNTIAANPGADGFQRQFTGTSSTPHFTWIGKLLCSDGTLMNSTYMGEYTEGYSGGTPFPAGHPLAGWPNPNTGWAQLNDTRTVRNTTKVSADGSVYVIAKGRRTMTTTDAYFPNLLPGTGTGSWNSFVRVYAPDLSAVEYSSMVDAPWSTTGTGSDITQLLGIFKTNKGLLVVGHHKENGSTGSHAGNAYNTLNVPSWGQSTPSNQSAVFSYLKATSITDAEDGVIPSSVNQAPVANNNNTSTNENASIVFTNIIGDDTDELALNFANIDLDISTAGIQPTISTTEGTWVLDVSNGQVTFTPTTGFIGVASITYEICDGGAPVLCDQAILSVTVNDVNTIPQIQDNSATTSINTPVVITNILSNDSDDLPLTNNMIDLDITTLGIQTSFVTSDGTWSLNTSNGDVTFTPISTFSGTTTITYEVCDDGTPELCGQATLTVIVDNPTVNDAPIANDNNTNTTQGTAVIIANILGDDVDDQPLTTAMIDLDITTVGVQTSMITADGTWVLDLVTGNVSFTPSASFVGTATLVYELCDGGLPQLCDFGTLTIEVTLGLNTQNLASFDIFPNPASETISIVYSGFGAVKIFQMNGQLVFDSTISNEIVLDISKLAKGTYFVQLQSDDIITRKYFQKL